MVNRNSMKHAIYSFCCTAVFLCTVGLFVTNSQAYITPVAVVESENDKHDWECNYIIHDHYHGFIKAHYVDSYEELVTGGIKFTSHDGNTYQIPYPYFTIEVRR